MTEYLTGLEELVAEHGFAVQGVFGDTADESFSYTVGMTKAGLPELWIATLDPRMAAQLLNALGALQLSSDKPLEGEVDCGWTVPFQVRGPVDVEAASVGVALKLYPHPQLVTVSQVMFPDPAGRFPDDEAGYDFASLPQRVLALRGEDTL